MHRRFQVSPQAGFSLPFHPEFGHTDFSMVFFVVLVVLVTCLTHSGEGGFSMEESGCRKSEDRQSGFSLPGLPWSHMTLPCMALTITTSMAANSSPVRLMRRRPWVPSLEVGCTIFMRGMTKALGSMPSNPV